MYYCRLCGFYSEKSGTCIRCKNGMTEVKPGHRAKCIKVGCETEFQIETLENLQGCPQCEAPRVMLIGPGKPPSLTLHIPRGDSSSSNQHVITSNISDLPFPHSKHKFEPAFISVDVVLIYWAEKVRKMEDPTAESILKSLHESNVASLSDLWNMREEQRAGLPEQIFKEEFQSEAIESWFVARNGTFLDDEPVPSAESLSLTEAPVYGYNVADCLKKEGETFRDMGLPKPENWTTAADKAWQNFLQEEGCIPDYLFGDVKQILSPVEAAWPVPPSLRLDAGSRELLKQAANFDTAYIGAVNIFSGVVYVFPLVPHPCYYSDYAEGDSIPDGYYRPKTDGFMPYVYRPRVRIISKSQARMSVDSCGGTESAGVKANCPNFQKVWVWDTGELLHGIFHKTAPPVIYRLVSPSHKDTALSAHIKLVESVLLGTANDYVGFTFYLRSGLSGVRRKYLRPNSTGCNAHKFKSCDARPKDFLYKNAYVNMPPDWLKALFGCFFSEGFFDYFSEAKYPEAKKSGVEEYRIRMKDLMKAVNAPPPPPPPTDTKPSVKPVWAKVVIPQDQPKVKAEPKAPEVPPPPTTDKCKICGTWLSWRWPQRCLKCHPIDYEKFPKWNPSTREFVWGASVSDPALTSFHMGTKPFEPPSEYSKYGCDPVLMEKFLTNPQRFVKTKEVKQGFPYKPRKELGTMVAEMVQKLERKN